MKMTARREDNNRELRISGARLIFKNFSGKPDKYTRDVRKFNLCLPEDLARELKADGWNIKFPKDPDSDLLQRSVPQVYNKLKYQFHQLLFHS